MQKPDFDRYSMKLLAAATFSVFLVLVFYPDVVLLKKTPMHVGGWELSDKMAGFMNFIPGYKVLQYELFTNKNILWSNLRSMGMPLLANDIQAAPLFPLTLLLCWIPADYFWNFYIVVRLVLMAAGAFLLARDFLKFKTIPSFFFTLCFVYSMYVLRWMNHPWQNGLLAGIWYLYFLSLLPTGSSLPYCMRRFRVVAGLAASVYAMVTCGFPEGAAMSAGLVVLVYVPFLVHLLRTGNIKLRSFFYDLLAAHAIGFALSSAQIFSIFEMLTLFVDNAYRATAGTRQFGGMDFFPFWAENIGRITGSKPVLFNDSRTYLGLIPLFFFLFGLMWSAKRFRRLDYRHAGAFLCAFFVLFKFFPVWPAFNSIIGGLPILKDSYFFVYFFTIFLWFFAFYVAQGVQLILSDDQLGTTRILIGKNVMILLSAGGVLALLGWSVSIIYEMPLAELLRKAEGDTPVVVLSMFLVAVLAALFFRTLRWGTYARICLGLILIGAATTEMATVMPRNFNGLLEDNSMNRVGGELAMEIERQGISLPDVRMKDSYAYYVSAGIATIDDGAPALLPYRLFTFRRALFDVHGGYFPVRWPYFNYSWALTSTSLFATNRYWGGASPPPWQSRQAVEGSADDLIVVDVVRSGGHDLPQSRETVLSGQQTLFLSGWAVDLLSGEPDDSVPVFVVFRSDGKEISVPTKKVPRFGVAAFLKSESAINAGWQTEVEAGLFEPGTYEILVRVLRSDNRTYLEQASGRTVRFANNLEDRRNFIARQDKFGKGGNYITVIPDGFIYYDEKALSRAYKASRCFSVDNFSVARERMRDSHAFSLGDVFIEDLSASEREFCNSFRSTEPLAVPIEHDRGREVALESVSGPAVVVLNDNYYPGWKAFDEVSGQELTIRPANISVRALILPEERGYKIVFKYIPSWLMTMKILCGSALILMAILLYLALRKTGSGMRNPID